MEIELWTNLPDVARERIRRLRRAEYDRLVELGMFAQERVELIRGVIVRMSPQGPAHAGLVEALTELLVLALRGRARVRVQLPLAAGEDSEPEPDLAVVAPGRHDREHPATAHLVIEVARSSATYDRSTKGPLYAELGVAEYWLVDADAGVIEVYRQPVGDRYTHAAPYRRGDSIALLAFPDVAVAVADVFP